MDFQHSTLERLKLLSEKYAAMGQDLDAYLDGLLYADYLTYWDYIHLDTLLSLQTPRTPIPDEMIFVTYHQITELYFKLSIHALSQVCDMPHPDVDLFIRQIDRVNMYFDQLNSSFETVVGGMDKDEFLKFRMSLLPASGFQSAQFRKIELMCADMIRLTHVSVRDTPEMAQAPKAEMYEYLYWKRGATELATGTKTLTLRQFEHKYSSEFIRWAEEYNHKNLWQKYLAFSPEDQSRPELIEAMRRLDLNCNVRWNLAHFRAAVKHLERKPADIAATGGTNWQQYLPPKFQLVMFFPTLWAEEERAQWGRF